MNRSFVLVACVIVLSLAADVRAASLSFNVAPGDMRYDPASQSFAAIGTVTAGNGLSIDPAGQPFRLSAMLQDVTIDAIAGTFVANFASVAGPDVEIDGLLIGELQSLSMIGALGSDFGLLSGQVVVAGLLLPDLDGDAALVSLQLAMSAPFSATLLAQQFTASLDGQLIGAVVTEPLPVAGLLLGFLLPLVVGRLLRNRAVAA